MNQNTTLNNLTGLFICPTSFWGTVERQVLKDILYFIEGGGKPILFCLKDSFLDKKASELNINRVYYSGKRIRKLIDISYLVNLRSMFKEQHFDIVHCYSIIHIWPVAFLLSTNTKTSLFLTFNSYLSKYTKNIFYKWLVKRIDLVFIYMSAVKEIILDNTTVVNKQVLINGASFPKIEIEEERNSSKKVIGTFVPAGRDNSKSIDTLLNMFPSLMYKLGDKSQNVKLLIIFEDENNFKSLKEEIERKTIELDILKEVEVRCSENIEAAYKEFDILLSFEFAEPFNDREIVALLHSLPIIVPRTSARQRLFSSNSRLGHTFHQYDAREIRDNILKILENEEEYIQEIKMYQQKIMRLHETAQCQKILLDSYNNMRSKRLRLNFENPK